MQDIEHTDEPMHYAPPPPPPPPPPAVAQPIQLSSEAADEKRWRYLCDYHPRISEAVRRVEPLGAEALDELKSAYLALNDATLLPGILRRIEERFGTGRARPTIPSASFPRPPTTTNRSIFHGRLQSPKASSATGPLRRRL